MINKSVLSKKKLNNKIESLLNPIKDELVTRARSMMDYVAHHEDDLKQAIDKTIETKAHQMDAQWDDSDTIFVVCDLILSAVTKPALAHSNNPEYSLDLHLPTRYTADIDASKLPDDKSKFIMSADQYLNNYVTAENFYYDYKQNALSCTLAKDVYLQKVSHDLSELFTQYLYNQGIKANIKEIGERIVIQINRNDFELDNEVD